MRARKSSKVPMVIGSAVVTALLLAMSGACSQHEPGSWQGGGRGFEVPTAQGSTTVPDSGKQDTFVPPDNFVPDNFVVDTGGGN